MKALVLLAKDLFFHPLRVFWVCLVFFFVAVVVEGSLFQLWNLRQASQRIDQQIVQMEKESIELKKQLQRAKEPKFIEWQAREQLDLAQKDEIIFVFQQSDQVKDL